MNYEEFSFFNQQLAGMLQSGLPLEGAMRQIAQTMRAGALRGEIEALERELGQGVPLSEAIAHRRLPELYVAMVQIGIKSNNLPGVLILLADYYRQMDTTWTRLKGLLFYPGVVLITSVVVSTALALVLSSIVGNMDPFRDLLPGRATVDHTMMLRVWIAPVLLTFLALVALICLSTRSVRNRIRWRVPLFREASLAQFATSLSMMLENGCDLNQALQLVENAEADRRAQSALRGWRSRLAGGARNFADVTQGALAPPLFVWLVASSGENWAAGLRRAAEVYRERARYRIELAMYAALPLAIVLVAGLMITEIAPILQGFIQFMSMLGDFSGE